MFVTLTLKAEASSHYSKDYKIAPSIDPNYLSEEKDKIVAAQSIKLARKIISQPAMKKYNPKEFAPVYSFNRR